MPAPVPTPRTSQTHPLRVDFVDAPHGRLGMTFAPGKHQPNATTGAWTRDLEVDLRRLREHYATDLLVSVIETHELETLKIPELPQAAARLGIRWLHVTVRDGDVPDDGSAWLAAIRSVREALEEGQTVVIHCKGGLGRTGTLAASVLTSYGAEPDEAIATVRAARPRAVENRGQEEYVVQARDGWRGPVDD